MKSPAEPLFSDGLGIMRSLLLSQSHHAGMIGRTISVPEQTPPQGRV
jgi:hypothetical protein